MQSLWLAPAKGRFIQSRIHGPTAPGAFIRGAYAVRIRARYRIAFGRVRLLQCVTERHVASLRRIAMCVLDTLAVPRADPWARSGQVTDGDQPVVGAVSGTRRPGCGFRSSLVG